jgi:hypothetical protein
MIRDGLQVLFRPLYQATPSDTFRVDYTSRIWGLDLAKIAYGY